MSTLLAKAKVVLSGAVTWLLAISSLLMFAARQVAEIAPGNTTLLTWLVRVTAWLATAVAVMRRVTPVLGEAQGLLATPGPATAREAALADQLKKAQAQARELEGLLRLQLGQKVEDVPVDEGEVGVERANENTDT